MAGTNSGPGPKLGKITDVLEEVEKQLKDEEDILMQVKESILKEIGVMKV